jgi:elongation factor P
MALLNYNEITLRKHIVHEGEPWEVVATQVSRKQQNKPVNKTKLKNLINGRVIDQTFHVSDKLAEAEMSTRDITFLYENEKKGDIWFCDTENPKERFTLEPLMLGDEFRFISEKTELVARVYTDKEDEDQIIGIKYPMKIELEVTQAPPNIKGDSATGGNKVVTVSTGATVQAPLFINVGDKIMVTIEAGTYSERSFKA